MRAKSHCWACRQGLNNRAFDAHALGMSRLDPAATAIDLCGGIMQTVELVGVHRTAVYPGTQPRGARGGTGRHKLIEKVPGLDEKDSNGLD